MEIDDRQVEKLKSLIVFYENAGSEVEKNLSDVDGKDYFLLKEKERLCAESVIRYLRDIVFPTN